MIIWLVVAAVIAIASYIFVHQVRLFVIRNQILDVPNDRSSHKVPTPRGGGIIIAAGVLFGLSLYVTSFDLENILPIMAFILGGTLITIVSVVDDIRSLPTGIRFGVQIVAALIVVWGMGGWNTLALPGVFSISLGWIGIPVALVWIIGLTNAYNFMDGIDGLASSQAIITGTAWAIIGWIWNEQTIFVWGLLVIATSAGFLLHNWHPAKIFMGDVGSAFLGFTFATIPLFAQWSQGENLVNQEAILFFAVITVWLFLYDSFFTFFRRLLRGENVLEPHRKHLYQLLTRAGSPHHHVTLLYNVLAILPVFVALNFFTIEEQISTWVTLGLITFLGFSLYILVRNRVSKTEIPILDHEQQLNLSFMFNNLSNIDSIRNRHLFIADLICIVGGSFLAYVLRFEKILQADEHLYSLFIFLAFSLLTIPTIFHFAGLYTRYWRYASLADLITVSANLFIANIVASVLTITLIWVGKFDSIVFPRSIPFIFFLLSLSGIMASRLGIRFLHWQFRQSKRPSERTAVAIMGAGDSGELLMREAQRDTKVRWDVRAFLDDDRAKHGMYIHGVPVIGGREKLETLKAHFGVSRIIIAMPSVDGAVIRELTRLADSVGIESKITPSLQELMTDTGLVKQIRDVAIEDLLRRQPIETDTTAVQSLLKGKRVLITGGGGSIGSELCRQVIRCQPAELILVGHGENSIFGSHNELKKLAKETKLTAVIADIRFPERVRWIFQEYRPEIVFHAAAHKHVPLMEMNPVEAITNNVFGTRNLLNAAQLVDVDHFVMISTDKAVNPTNVMGASKRAAELLVHQAAEKSGKTYVAVRFGNVLGSRGSVVLTFKEQIRNGGPVTVTHPEMTRFFMTIPEAVQLVLQAAVLGNGGDVFVLDMGQPVKIVDLAKDLIRLSGLELGRDIDIEFVGVRPGEKLYEELFIHGENYARTQHKKIFLAANASDLVPGEVEEWVEDLIDYAHLHQLDYLYKTLQKLVPEFAHPTLKTQN